MSADARARLPAGTCFRDLFHSEGEGVLRGGVEDEHARHGLGGRCRLSGWDSTLQRVTSVHSLQLSVASSLGDEAREVEK